MDVKDDARAVLKEVVDRLTSVYGDAQLATFLRVPPLPSQPVCELVSEIVRWLNATAEAAPKPEAAPIEISFCPRTLLAEVGGTDARPRAVTLTTPAGKITFSCTTP